MLWGSFFFCPSFYHNKFVTRQLTRITTTIVVGDCVRGQTCIAKNLFFNFTVFFPNNSMYTHVRMFFKIKIVYFWTTDIVGKKSKRLQIRIAMLDTIE